jgi:pimeloyl-ACP methyl ester carboxylesterase
MRSYELKAVTARMRFHDLPGSEPPILFIHGLGCASSCDYPRIATDPVLAGRRMILVDLLGSGFSDRPTDFSYTVEDHADSLRALINALSIPSVDLVGHSMGGTIAIVLAARNRTKVRKLVVSEPNLDAGGGVFSRPIAQQSEAQYVEHGHAEAVRSAITDGDAIWAGSLLVSAPFAIHRGATSLVRGGSPTWRDQLASLEIPRTVIFGAKSLPDPDTERLPQIGVTVRVVANAGHSMVWENPSGFAQAVSEALM